MDDDSGGDAHRGNPHGPALTVAECLRGALIGSIRRERLDHIIIANARGLRRVLDAYVAYYLKSWTHLSLSNAALVSRVA